MSKIILFVFIACFACCCTDEVERKQAVQAHDIGLSLLGRSIIDLPSNFLEIEVICGQQSSIYGRGEVEALRQKIYPNIAGSTHPSVRSHNGRNQQVGQINVRLGEVSYPIKIKQCLDHPTLYILEFYSLDSFGGSIHFIEKERLDNYLQNKKAK
jgi:hypothetical protein